MNKPWQVWVEKNQGDVGTENRVEFPDFFRQVAAVRDGNALAMLDGFSIIQLDGEDAETFLQGQLSGDIRAVTDGMASFSTYSTAKGRMLASFLIWKQQATYYLMVSSEICQAIAKRLSMFVMRSKVKVQVLDAEQFSIAGARGRQLQADIEQFFAVASPAPLTVLHGAAEMAIALPEGGYLLQLAAHSALLPTLLAAEATAVSSAAWRIRDIDAGIVWVEQATQEQFVPQMANMELIGAVSFKKGCYPGQEIVARTQYLGKLKRRLFKARLSAFAAVGSKLFSPEVPEQSIGMVAAICPVAEHAYEALVVVQTVCWEKGVYLEPEYLTRLERLSLPYVTQDE